MTTIKICDLFCGTGAFSISMHMQQTKKIKVKTVFANDMIDSSEDIFNLNNTCKLTNKDLTLIAPKDIPKHTLLAGGFPCQPFSQAGKKMGFNDPRSNVFFFIINILKYHNPRFVILENVRNLVTHDKGKTFKTVISNLENCGYHIKHEILNTCKVTDIPQNRERIYIICFKNKTDYTAFNFANVKKSPAFLRNIDEFLETKIPSKYYYTKKFKVYPIIKAGVVDHVKNNAIYQFRRKYVRQNMNGVCPTLTRTMGTGGHNVPLILDDKGIRKLTPRECFNLQGFPKSYKLPDLSDSKLYQLSGNAVTVSVVQKIAKELFSII